jgi:signal transduction histidine kinase
VTTRSVLPLAALAAGISALSASLGVHDPVVLVVVGGGLVGSGLFGLGAELGRRRAQADLEILASSLRDWAAGEPTHPLMLPPGTPQRLEQATSLLTAQRQQAVAREAEQASHVGRALLDLQEARAELQATQRRFLASIEVKDAFLARMSHELRTPLNAVLGYAELLLEEASGESSEDLQQIRAAALNLLGIVTAVLDLTDLQSGSYTIRPEPLSLDELSRQALESVRIVAETNSNVLVSRVEPILVLLDRRMIRSILFNLLSNACKYTSGGTVTLTAGCEGGRLLLRVADTGIGMTERQIEEAFRPFSQGDESTRRLYDGTGLGLAVVRGFVEAMSGRLQIYSERGQGATVTVDLPAGIEALDPESDADEPTILVR